MKTVKASSLVLDFTIYPRFNVDSQHVDSLVVALSAGAELPPIIVEKKSKRVVDGVHRTKAHLAYFGDDATISIIEKTYKSEGDLFLDAMRYNADHGVKLTANDRAHCITIAQKVGLSLDAVAGALHLPPDKLGELKNTRLAYDRSGLTNIPLKRTIQHMAGKKLTDRQVEANAKLSGMNQAFYANQLIELIESEMLDLSNERTMESLKKLHELLESLLVAH